MRHRTFALALLGTACGGPAADGAAGAETDPASTWEGIDTDESPPATGGAADDDDDDEGDDDDDDDDSSPVVDAGVPMGDGEVYVVAVDGDDAGAGTEEAPFATIDRAIEAVVPGDTIYVREGTYALTTSIQIDKSGTPDDPIVLSAYPGEHPVLDFSANPRHANPPQPRDDDSIAATVDAIGIFVSGDADWWHLYGLEIQHAAYYGVRVYGSNNVFERLVLHDHKASGLELTGKEGWSPSDNLVLDCDSFHNFDPQTNGEDADGFAAKFDSLGTGNVFHGTRAWSNSDDGYDFWHAAPVLVEHAWAFDNGYNRPEWVDQLSGGWAGDGMGFKLGQDAAELTLNHVVAFGNKAFGIDENGNGSPGGVTINHATLVANAKDGNPVQLDLNDGSPHTVRNSIAFDLDAGAFINLDGSVDDASNSWNGPGVSAADFVDVDLDALLDAAKAPRDADGGLPALGLWLSPDSGLIDAGVDVGLDFSGVAPDLGAFERE